MAPAQRGDRIVTVSGPKVVANEELRLGNLGVNLFIHDLAHAFLTGRFSDHGFIFRSNDEENTEMIIELTRYAPGDEVIVLMEYRRRGAPTGAYSRMVVHDWSAVYPDWEDYEYENSTDSAIERWIDSAGDALRSVQVDRREITRNAEEMADRVFSYVLSAERRLSRNR